MKKTLLTVLTISLSFLSFGQDGMENLIFKNKVKAIYEVSWNEKKNNVDTIGYKTYDKNYRLIEEYSKKHPFKHRLFYDQNGLLIKKIKLDNTNNKKSKKIWKYEYNRKGKLIKEVSYSPEFKGKYPILYSYDKQNQLISTTHINNNGEVYKSYERKYYKSGELHEI